MLTTGPSVELPEHLEECSCTDCVIRRRRMRHGIAAARALSWLDYWQPTPEDEQELAAIFAREVNNG